MRLVLGVAVSAAVASWLAYRRYTRRRAAPPLDSITLNSGAHMPLIGLGTWKQSPGVVKEAVCCALRCGYRHVDAAHCYNNEHEVGAGITASLAAGVCTREELFVASKLWCTKHREDQVWAHIPAPLRSAHR